ncbi:MFS transporter [Sphingomonas sp. CGMCC 1.13654]|uniref:MFS transporter n=1 Tax=Sphingomonas chungangi TaxID=2683589 RepID=A0A838L4I7_9SPHN|nr:MFS transporter [Sphingomonas chungangi]MBA2933482.1 MFS transporter [Sphingomonas chungangi]MVW54815.1 MFS transporter [Sphingomonas chungangi]
MHGSGQRVDYPATGDATAGWDTAYERRAITLLSLGFGLVAFDRFLILPMFPVIMKDLRLDYGDLGTITGALAITWGLSALLMGNLADRFGRRAVLVGAMAAFSLLVGFSGMATGALSLVLIRSVMGAAEGAYVPPSIAATLEASRPDRHGLSLGIQQMMAPLLGLGLAPVLVTQLMPSINWRWIFLIVAVPGLLVALLTARTLRDPDPAQAGAQARPIWASLRDLIGYRNVLIAAGGMLCWLNCLIVLSAFLPSYLVDHLHLGMTQMGFTMSAMGIGAVVGSVVGPAISDRAGRKPTMIVMALCTIAGLAALAAAPADPTALFTALLLAAFFLYGLLTITVGPVAVESVPVALRATASGAVIAVAELIGGGLAPVLAGAVARRAGIDSIFWLAIGGIVIGCLLSLALVETAPAVVRRRASRHLAE